MLREAVSQGVEAGLQAKAFMDRGELVPDQLVIGIILDRIQHADCVSRGWMLDGFPRTNVQAQALLKAGVSCDAVVYIDVPDSLLVERAVGRRLDPETGKIYHLQYSPPPPEIMGRLLHRSDDSESKVKFRLKAFHQHVGSILNTFPDSIIRVAGDRAVGAVWNDVLLQLNRMLRKRVVFVIGGPGTGKRTQCEGMAGSLGYAHIDAIVLLKAERRNSLSAVAGDIADCLVSNTPVPPAITINLIKNAMDNSFGQKFVISNFPRNHQDLSAWLEIMGGSTILEFTVILAGPDGICQERLSSRGNTSPGKDSETMFNIVSRIKTYKQETGPLIASLKRMGKARVISVVPPADAVFAQISRLVRSIDLIAPFERTLAILKPDAVANGNAPDILREIAASGLVVLDTRFVLMDNEAVDAFYAEHMGKPFFPKLSAFMTSGPALVLLLEGVEAVSKWRSLMGPTNTNVAAIEAPSSLRARFGTDGTQNACHGSDSSRSAMRELDFWYDVFTGPGHRLAIGVGERATPVLLSADADPSKIDCGIAEETTFAAIKPFTADANYEHIMSIILGHGFTVTAETRTTLTPEEVDHLYEDIKTRPFFPPLRRYMSSGPMVVMLLSRIGAIPAWRYLMGGSDLDKTRAERPDSVRALFAIDSIKNAVHGSENYQAVQRSRKFFFSIGATQSATKKVEAVEEVPSASDTELDGAYDPVIAAKNRRKKRAKASQAMSMAKYGNLAEYLISNVDPIIKELTTHVMQKRPADVIGFAIKDLVEMQRTSFKAKPESSKLSSVGSLGALRKFPSQSPLKSRSTNALPSIDANEGISVIAEEEEAPTFNGNPLTVDIARMEISRLQTMVVNISQNVRDSISESQPSDLDKIDPELIRRMTRRELSIIHMGNTYDYCYKAPLFSSIAKKLSLNSAKRKAGPCLVLHSGGFASGGGMLSSASIQDDVRKNHVSVLNEIGVHFGVLGLHDFQLGLPTLRALLENSTTTWLCSNLVDPFNGKNLSGTQQYVVLDWNGVKIGLLGFVGDWLGQCSRITANDIQYLDVCETATKLCSEMRLQGAGCIIALSHCSNALNDELSRSVSELDLILGGQDLQYRAVIHEEGDIGAVVVNSGSNFEDLSRIKVFIQEGDRRPTVQWPPLRYTVRGDDFPGLVPDENVANICEELLACDTEVSSRDMIAYCDVVLDCTAESLRTGESGVANLFADILRKHGEANVALIHGGFIRSNSIQPTGFMALSTLQNILAFDDVAVTLDLTGAQIKKALENGVSRVASNDGRFLHASGLSYYFNPDDAVGYRVSNVQILRNVEGGVPVFESLHPDAVYSCVLPSYIANGGDGFSFLSAVPWKDPKCSCRMIKHIILESLQRRIKPVNAQADLTITDFDSIDNKPEDRIVRVRSTQAMFEEGDDESLGDEGTVQTSTAICDDDDGGNSIVGESSVVPDETQNDNV